MEMTLAQRRKTKKQSTNKLSDFQKIQLQLQLDVKALLKHDLILLSGNPILDSILRLIESFSSQDENEEDEKTG